MIEELNVKNFALIDSLNLSLEKGFSILTGETGAGKSIIVGSISFLLGARADTEVIRTGCEEASVSATLFLNGDNHDALSWLKERDIEPEDSRIIVRRNVRTKGRSSIYIQNIPVSRTELSDFMGFLFDLHGQHSHESLLKKEAHRVYLDRFGGFEAEAVSLNRVFLELTERNRSLEALNNSERDREGRLDLLNYAVDEISKANVKSGEIKELESEVQRLGDFEKLSSYVNAALGTLSDSDSGSGSLLELARRSRAAMDSAAAIDNNLNPILKRMEDLYYEAEDLAAEFRDYRDSLSYDPSRLEAAEERLSLLYRLNKKYKCSNEDDLLAYLNNAQIEIETLSGSEDNKEKIKADISRLEKDLTSRAAALSSKRKEAASRLSEGITEILSRLGMPKANFSVQVRIKTKDTDANGSGEKKLICGPWGSDDIEFMISANTGEPLKELARIASGGELSRVMLAIKTILCTVSTGKDHSADTLVFDEIDTGIGGEVALSVGEYLSRIGREKQILCVTHLASIAVRADNHLKVEKRIIEDKNSGKSGERTITELILLDMEAKRQEIARMLAGDSGTAALAHADELILKYGTGVKNG